MIKQVRIENYRSIENVHIELSSLCALVGENNAGKSNIMGALKAVLGKPWLSVKDFQESDIRDNNSELDVVIKLHLDPPLIYEGYSSETPAEVPILKFTLTRYKKDTASHRKGDLRLQSECLQTNGKPIQVLASAPKKGEPRKYKPLVSIPESLKSQVPLIFIGPDRRLQKQLPGARYSLLRRLLEDVSTVLMDSTIDDGGVARPLLDMFSERLEASLNLLRVDEFIELEEHIRQYSREHLGYKPEDDQEFSVQFGLFEPMEFLKAIKLLVDEGKRGIHLATNLGDGAQSAIVVAIMRAYEKLQKKGAIFLIEEPEMHLHPHMARNFYRVLKRISETNQVIYTTHSPHFVSIPEYHQVRLVSRNTNSLTTVRASSLERTDRLDEKLRKELDVNRNELFFAKHIVLVEGPTEKLALPEFAHRLGLELDRKGCSVIEVSGKRNLVAFAEVVKSFQIPLTVVYDEDSSDFGKDKRQEEHEYNKTLELLADEITNVVCLNPKYESVIRQEIGDELYQSLCQRYPSHGKPVRGRLIAADLDCPVPSFVNDVFRSLL